MLNVTLILLVACYLMSIAVAYLLGRYDKRLRRFSKRVQAFQIAADIAAQKRKEAPTNVVQLNAHPISGSDDIDDCDGVAELRIIAITSRSPSTRDWVCIHGRFMNVECDRCYDEIRSRTKV